MSETNPLVISARLEEVRHACDFVVEAAKITGLDERAIYHCQIVVDETLTNIIEHGYHYQDDANQIEIICKTEPECFLITVIDNSPPFNLLEHDQPDLSTPLDEREPGGWGIYFVRRLMDDVTYQHDGTHNYLTLSKKLSAAKPATLSPQHTDDVFPTHQVENNVAVITPFGRLDGNTSPKLNHVLSHQLQQNIPWLLVDMSKVDYIASNGLKVLVSAWRRAREQQGDVILCGLQPRVIEIFEMVGFDVLFEMYPDINTALATRPAKN